MSVREKRSYPVLYMFAVTFVAAGVLIGLNRFTSDRVEANRQVFFERAVLGALGWDAPSEMPPAEVHREFRAHVRKPGSNTAGAYTLVRDNTPTAYALPFQGEGFWNTIKGVIGIKIDGSAMTGIGFYEQNETPGLGAEIVKPYFTDQFEGLELERGRTPLVFKTVGEATGAGEVDAITGATQTCTRLEDIINEAIRQWRREMGLSAGTGGSR
jgi:Na+-transporting NADH:ubiquinone oxidoreductase subunit C